MLYYTLQCKKKVLIKKYINSNSKKKHILKK